jgi:hypothetical protein
VCNLSVDEMCPCVDWNGRHKQEMNSIQGHKVNAGIKAILIVQYTISI